MQTSQLNKWNKDDSMKKQWFSLLFDINLTWKQNKLPNLHRTCLCIALIPLFSLITQVQQKQKLWVSVQHILFPRKGQNEQTHEHYIFESFNIDWLLTSLHMVSMFASAG